MGWRIECATTAEIAAAKRVIYDALVAAIDAGVPRDKAGILVDEQFGAAILRDAIKDGYTTCCPAEKSGQEYGEDFEKHIEAFRPTFCKILVRYNPEVDRDLNRRQSVRLKRLSEYLHSNKSRSRFMVELLVPAEKSQLDRLNGDKKTYDLELRPRLAAQAIQEAGVEPDVWKIEGLERQEDCERNPLVDWRAKKITREAAVAEIARQYQGFVDIFDTREKAVPA